MSSLQKDVSKKRYPIIAACKHARLKGSRDSVDHSPQNKLCQFGKCKGMTRYHGVDVMPSFVTSMAKRRKRTCIDLYSPPPSKSLPICKLCFDFALWHINHKWNILALLSRTFPNVSRDVWRHIETFLWVRQ